MVASLATSYHHSYSGFWLDILPELVIFVTSVFIGLLGSREVRRQTNAWVSFRQLFLTFHVCTKNEQLISCLSPKMDRSDSAKSRLQPSVPMSNPPPVNSVTSFQKSLKGIIAGKSFGQCFCLCVICFRE